MISTYNGSYIHKQLSVDASAKKKKRREKTKVHKRVRLDLSAGELGDRG